MALQTTVKISNVTNLSDARYCAGMGVDMLGFSMDTDSEEYVSPEKLAEIRSWVAGVHIVGETASLDALAIEQLVKTYEPDVLQVEEVGLLPYVQTFDKPIIVKIDLAQLTIDQLEALMTTSHPGQVDYFLLESRGNVSLDDELKDVMRQLTTRYRVLLGVGVSADNVHALLAELPIQGIALTGGDEISPGNKDFGELMDILESLETDD